MPAKDNEMEVSNLTFTSLKALKQYSEWILVYNSGAVTSQHTHQSRGGGVRSTYPNSNHDFSTKEEKTALAWPDVIICNRKTKLQQLKRYHPVLCEKFLGESFVDFGNQFIASVCAKLDSQQNSLEISFSVGADFTALSILR